MVLYLKIWRRIIMSIARPYQRRDGHFPRDIRLSSHVRCNNVGMSATSASNFNYNYIANPCNTYDLINQDFSAKYFRDFVPHGSNYDHVWSNVVPSTKRRKLSVLSTERHGISYQPEVMHKSCYENNSMWQNISSSRSNALWNGHSAYSYIPAVDTSNRSNDPSSNVPSTLKRGRSVFEGDEEVIFVSRDEIEKSSPSRKDGIDSFNETHLRYSYCAFLQDLGHQLDLPQTTIGTAMVLCHRFFFRRSHASHDRFLVATAAIFLASKSEESQRPLNDVLRVSCEILHKQDFTHLSYMMPIDWFEQYRERIIETEQLILTTLNFELNVQHPYEPLTSTLEKLGFSQSALVNLALNLVNEGLRTSLWLQFKPQQIAAGAAYLAAKFLNMNLASCHSVWNEFRTPPIILRDVAHQLMELF